MEFGSVRNYFEGKYLGDRYVQEVKNAQLCCPSTNITGTLLQRLHKGKAIENLVDTQSDAVKSFRATDASNNKDPKRQSLRGMVRVYKGREMAVREFNAYKPISVLQSTEGFGMLFYNRGCNRGEIQYLKIIHFEEVKSIHDGLRYGQWELSDTVLGFDQWEVKDFVVLLPKIDGEKDKRKTSEYTMATWDHSSAMLEHYDYSSVGIRSKNEQMNNPCDVEEGWV